MDRGVARIFSVAQTQPQKDSVTAKREEGPGGKHQQTRIEDLLPEEPQRLITLLKILEKQQTKT